MKKRNDIYLKAGIIMKNILLILIVFLFFRMVNARETSDVLHVKHDACRWVEDNFAKNKTPPFSFAYGGRNSDSFITKWDYKVDITESTDPSINESVYTYSDKKGGLVVKCFVTYYNDFPAVEWVLKFSNNSKRNTPVIEKVHAVNHTFSYNKNGTFILHHANGVNSERSDFRPYDDELKIGESVYMTPTGGRSSGGTSFPFFNIESPANLKGISILKRNSTCNYGELFLILNNMFNVVEKYD